MATPDREHGAIPLLWPYPKKLFRAPDIVYTLECTSVAGVRDGNGVRSDDARTATSARVAPAAAAAAAAAVPVLVHVECTAVHESFPALLSHLEELLRYYSLEFSVEFVVNDVLQRASAGGGGPPQQASVHARADADGGRAPSVRVQFVNSVQGCTKASALRAKHAYRLVVNDDGVLLSATSVRGMFYCICTLRQYLLSMATPGGATDGSGGARTLCIPGVVVIDWPDLEVRAVSLDMSCGEVPTVGTLIAHLAMLAYLKVNRVELYMEKSFDFAAYRNTIRARVGDASFVDGGTYLGVNDINILEEVCERYFVELVPSQQCYDTCVDWFACGRAFQSLATERSAASAVSGRPPPSALFNRDCPNVHTRGSERWAVFNTPCNCADCMARECELYHSDSAMSLRGETGVFNFVMSLYDEILPNFTSLLTNANMWNPTVLRAAGSPCGRGGVSTPAVTEAQHTLRQYMQHVSTVVAAVEDKGRFVEMYADGIVKLHEALVAASRAAGGDSYGGGSAYDDDSDAVVPPLPELLASLGDSVVWALSYRSRDAAEAYASVLARNGNEFVLALPLHRAAGNMSPSLLGGASTPLNACIIDAIQCCEVADRVGASGVLLLDHRHAVHLGVLAGSLYATTACSGLMWSVAAGKRRCTSSYLSNVFDVVVMNAPVQQRADASGGSLGQVRHAMASGSLPLWVPLPSNAQPLRKCWVDCVADVVTLLDIARAGATTPNDQYAIPAWYDDVKTVRRLAKLQVRLYALLDTVNAEAVLLRDMPAPEQHRQHRQQPLYRLALLDTKCELELLLVLCGELLCATERTSHGGRGDGSVYTTLCADVVVEYSRLCGALFMKSRADGSVPATQQIQRWLSVVRTDVVGDARQLRGGGGMAADALELLLSPTAVAVAVAAAGVVALYAARTLFQRR